MTVSEMVENGTLKWPIGWTSQFPILSTDLVASKEDTVKWFSQNGKLKQFSIKTVWEETRAAQPVMQWLS